MQIRALHDKIFFEFLDEVGSTTFNNKTEFGIVYKSFDHDTKTPRWGKVLTVGPKVTSIVEGDEIMIEPLQWTNKVEYDGKTFWLTDESKVMLKR